MNKKALILEDEILIADTIKRYLFSKNYAVTGIAISYEEAVSLFQANPPDIVLIDINLNGKKTGIDFAVYLREQPRKVPFVYLTAQLDTQNLGEAKKTLPAGYLSKPIQKSSLFTTLEVALHNHQEATKQTFCFVSIENGRAIRVLADEIESLKADHVYVKFILTNNRNFLCRVSLKEVLDTLSSEGFIQTHRSYAVNPKHINSWDRDALYFSNYPVPISRSYRSQVLETLNTRAAQNK